MGKKDKQSQIKKDDSKEMNKGGGGVLARQGTWSGNVSLPLQPATSYHRASTDK